MTGMEYRCWAASGQRKQEQGDATEAEVQAKRDQLEQEIREVEEQKAVVDKEVAEAAEAKADAIREKEEADQARKDAIREKAEAIEARESALKEKQEAVEAREEARKEKEAAKEARKDAIKEKDEADEARQKAVIEKAEAVEARSAAKAAKEASIKALREVRHQEIDMQTNDWKRNRVLSADAMRDDDEIYRVIFAPAKRMLDAEKSETRGKTAKRKVTNKIYAMERCAGYVQEDREFLSQCFELLDSGAHPPACVPESCPCPALTPM